MKNDKFIIASLIRNKDIETIIKNKANIKAAFIIKSNFTNLKSIVELFQQHDIDTYIHVEKIEGLKLDTFGFKYIKNEIKPKGIITTKSNHIKIAKSLNLFVIQRFFLADNDMLDHIIETTKKNKPDLIEIMPSITSHMFSKIKNNTNINIIAGGLVDSIEIVYQAKKFGAEGISTSNVNLWSEKFT